MRLNLIDNRAIDESALARLGSRGLLRSAHTGLQVVLGPIADQVAGEIRDAMRMGAAPQVAVREDDSRRDASREEAVREEAVRKEAVREDAVRNPNATAMLAALGGRRNVAGIESHAGRVTRARRRWQSRR